MDRQETIAYILSRGLFDVIPICHTEEKICKEQMFTHLWSTCWTDSHEFNGTINLTRGNKIQKQTRMLTVISNLNIFTYRDCILTLGSFGRLLLENACKEIEMNKNVEINTVTIEKIAQRLGEHTIMINDLNSHVLSITNQINVLKKSLIKPV
jgi:hypothetical protein